MTGLRMTCSAKHIGYHLGRGDAHYRHIRGCIGHPIGHRVGLGRDKGWLQGWDHTHWDRLRAEECISLERWCWWGNGSRWRRLKNWLQRGSWGLWLLDPDAL